MSKFIPEIYKRLGTTVSVDLGLKAELAAIHDDIKALPPQVTGVQNNMDLKAQALTQAMHLDNGVTRGKIADAINEVASSRQQVLERVDMLAEGVGKRFEQLNDKLGKVQDTTTTTMAALLQEQEEARAWRKEVLEAIDKLRRQHKRTDVDQ
jgi:hypothetical protein